MTKSQRTIARVVIALIATTFSPWAEAQAVGRIHVSAPELVRFRIAQAPSGTSDVTIRVAIVKADLTVVAVPRRTLIITSTSGALDTPVHVTTSLDGTAQVKLPPGTYRIASESPVAYEGSMYAWDLSLEVGSQARTVELSNDNAVVTAGAPAPAPTPTVTAPPSNEASAIYAAAADSIVTLEAESGHGSAFLVDASGLLMTNQHVISGSRSFIVNFSQAERYRSVLIASDPVADIAILRIHPDAVGDRRPLPIAPDSIAQPALNIGERVFAIGSPLSQQKIITAGIVSKVEDNAIISDVSLDAGNSGGPLLNASGNVVGINTFGEGRGVSGIIRIANALPLLEEAVQKSAMFWTPSAAQLPPYPQSRYPADAIRTLVLEEEFDLRDYLVRTRKFDILILTPPAVIYNELQVEIETAKAREKKRKRKGVSEGVRYDPTDEIKAWGEYVGRAAPTVKVLVQPRIKATGGSIFASVLLGAGALNYKYAGEFDDLQLLRGGVEQPIIKLGRDMIRSQAAGTGGRMEDAAYAGYAEYLPTAFFSTGGSDEELTPIIGNELEPDDKIEAKVPSKILDRIKRDFALVTVEN